MTAKMYWLTDSADWTQLYRNVRKLRIENVSIFGSQQWPNNDGLDLESCQDVVVKNVDSFTGDDGIIFSSGNTNNMLHPLNPSQITPCQNILVENCRFSSYSSGIKFSAIFQPNHAEISNITIRDTVVENAARGIGFQQRTGLGYFQDILFERVKVLRTRQIEGSNWWSAGEAVWMTSVPQSPSVQLNGIRRVTFKDCEFESEQGIQMINKNSKIDSILFSNTKNTIGVYGNATRRGVHDLRPLDQAPFQLSAPVSGVWYEGITQLKMENGQVQFVGPSQPYWEAGDRWCYNGPNQEAIQWINQTCSKSN